MVAFQTFEEIDAWMKAGILADRIFKRSMDNIAEGFERSGNREFIQFLSIPKGSAGETRSQLYRAADRNHITVSEFNSLQQEATQGSKQISSHMKYLRSSDVKGIKFRQGTG